jgi:hypothetical protein
MEFSIVYTFIGARAFEVDHGAKAPRKCCSLKVWTQRFQSLGPDLPKAEFKRLQTDMDNFIEREI